MLARQQQEAAGRAAAAGNATTILPAAAGLAAAAGRLSHLFMVLEQRRRSAGVTGAGRRLGLRLSTLPSPLLQVPPHLLVAPVVLIFTRLFQLPLYPPFSYRRLSQLPLAPAILFIATRLFQLPPCSPPSYRRPPTF